MLCALGFQEPLLIQVRLSLLYSRAASAACLPVSQHQGAHHKLCKEFLSAGLKPA